MTNDSTEKPASDRPERTAQARSKRRRPAAASRFVVGGIAAAAGVAMVGAMAQAAKDAAPPIPSDVVTNVVVVEAPPRTLPQILEPSVLDAAPPVTTQAPQPPQAPSTTQAPTTTTTISQGS